MSEDDARSRALTDTLLGLSTEHTQSLRVIRDDALEVAQLPTVDPGGSFRLSQGPLPEAAVANDLLILSGEVDPAEVDALAVSLWDDAGWLSPGVLRLRGDDHLRGPYDLDRAARARLGVGSWATMAFAYAHPGTGSGPIPDELLTSHPLVRAYRDDQPAPAQWEVIEGLYAMARRLAGAWRVGRGGALLQPDPDSATDLALYAPTWIEEADLRALITQAVPAASLVEAPAPQRPSGATRAARRRAERAVREWTEARLGSDEVERLAKESRAFDEMAAAHPAPIVGYALTLAAGHDSHIVVTVDATETVPPVLRWEPWASGSLAHIRVAWLAPTTPPPAQRPSRVYRVERLRVSETIEALASAIHHLLGGAVVDEDGFLVVLDPSSR
ncbi:hypothetical protein H8R18_06990 [Nanchangia anserum]|uniref:Uncharacterized protein n=1 Tax=Nanchangia anserum TaxID=2692125 RepID=A0A8I0GC39_9ACTO|nr:hypothetical protein [Nanchangia anserum]MBD3689276.1 hypothetical protein [Nanchangia anserum]QOX81495.1 hypothetical protein H8R18_06990 [Nanchangia anserum]